MRFSVVHSTVEQVEDEGRTMERKYREIERRQRRERRGLLNLKELFYIGLV